MTEQELLEQFALVVSEKDVDYILAENIPNYRAGKAVRNRLEARWEFARRMLEERRRLRELDRS